MNPSRLRIQFVGLGGIGSALIQPISKFLRYYDSTKYIEVVFIDGDKVEESNLSRQAFIPSDIQKYKSTIMEEEFVAKFDPTSSSRTLMTTSILNFLNDQNIKDLILENSITLCGVDNFPTKIMLTKHISTLNNALLILGANEYEDGDVNIFQRVKGIDLWPLYTKKHPEVLKKTGTLPDLQSCAQASESDPQLIMANQTAATIMCNAFFQYMQSEIDWHETFFNCRTGDFKVIR